MIAFLILNYNSSAFAAKCIESICKLNDLGKAVVLVMDNASTDGKLGELKNYALGLTELTVEFFESQENLGFSRGNNLGYKYLREHYDDIEYMVVTNPDIEFNDPDAVAKLRADGKTYAFDILGPDIYCPAEREWFSKGHQSPKYPYESAAGFVGKQVGNKRLELEKICSAQNNAAFWWIRNNLYRVYFKSYAEMAARKYAAFRNEPHIDAVLQGACLFLSRSFIEAEQAIFAPETTLYFEEPLLHLRMKRMGKTMVYDPEIQVTHHQGGSSGGAGEFTTRCYIESGEIYLEELAKSAC